MFHLHFYPKRLGMLFKIMCVMLTVEPCLAAEGAKKSHATSQGRRNNDLAEGVTGDLEKRDGKFFLKDLSSGQEVEVRYPGGELAGLVGKGVFSQGSYVTKSPPAVFAAASITNIDKEIPKVGSMIQSSSVPLFFRPQKGIKNSDLEKIQKSIEILTATPYKYGVWGDVKLGVGKEVKVNGIDGAVYGNFDDFPEKELRELKVSVREYLGWATSAPIKLRQPKTHDEFGALEILDDKNRVLGIVHFKTPAFVLLTHAGREFQTE